MTSLYQRTTRVVAIDAVAAPIRDAIAKYAADHQLSLEDVRVWTTHSVNLPSEGFFGKLFGSRANSADPDAEHDAVLVLHRTHVVVAVHGAKRGTAALGLPLLQASVTRGSAIAAKFPHLPAAATVGDGFSISGLPGDHGNVGSFFFGLGAEPAAEECFRALEQAIRAIKSG